MRWCLVLFFWLFPLAAMAQGTANLVADSVTVTADGQLIAEGNVVAFYNGTRLSAARITYDRNRDYVAIEGPILIAAPDGTILTAERADLDPQFENGLLRGARLVLDQQMQLAANRIERVDGRYNALRQVAVTSCQICSNRPPLWEIRAASVVHDEVAQQLYFEDATLRVRDIPIFWLPRMRLPDPTLERATGFLIPTIRTTNQLGFGIRTPYFITLGPSRDIRLTPYISPQTTTLEAMYRQAFLRGDLSVEGAVSRDSIQEGLTRGYLFADAVFELDRDLVLTFGIEAASDPSYLLDYGFSDQDRLSSMIRLDRVRTDSLFFADLTYYESLREDELDSTLPPVVAELSWERRMVPDRIGGILTLSTGAETFVRPGGSDESEGRDMTRIGMASDWQRTIVLPRGLLAETALRLDLDAYAVSDDPDFANDILNAAPAGAVTLRWPLIRAGSGAMAATNLIEPVLSLGYSTTIGTDVPNEDSILVEFDEANLLDLTRFPGQDAREEGARATIGLNWTRVGPAGGSSTLTFGRIYRTVDESGFSDASGLAGTSTDWLVAGQIVLAGGFILNGRALLDGDLEPGRSEARLNWANQTIDLTAAYVFLPADLSENRLDTVSEWNVDAAYQINSRWEVRADGRYDLAVNAPARAGFGIGWRNECVTVDLSVYRRYTSSTLVEPSTTFGLSVNLNGFSAGRTPAGVAGSCRG
jgi:LPS-assembly protein